MDALAYRDSFTIRREAQGLRSEFVVSDGAGEARFTREQLLSWIRAAIDDDLGINRNDGAAVTARLVEITVKMEAI